MELKEVTLAQMLTARDDRRERIADALRHYGLPLVSFSMNIPGPVKYSPLIRRGFREGCRRLKNALRQFPLTEIAHVETVTGCEVLYTVDADALAVKAICAQLEDQDALGRLFDMDIIGKNGEKLDRALLGLDERGCMVCGAPGRGCASRRLHTLDELHRETQRRLTEYFAVADRELVEHLATQSLLDEVNVTPKPGLVDRANSGSHRDMDLHLFHTSAAALSTYWGDCVEIGRKSAALTPEETFAQLRTAGLAAEQSMFAATNGVNTHKGAIFLLGCVCGAIGRLWDAAQPFRPVEEILNECRRMTAAPMAAEFERIRQREISDVSTAGVRLYLQYGLRGARGEIADGLPGVRDVALPALRGALAHGCSQEHAAAVALLHLIARGSDTNMVTRGGIEGAKFGAQAAKELLERSAVPSVEQIRVLDQQFIKRNLSPGGCADLLALTLFLYQWEKYL
ncbi:MAG: triphosphoribosyl-dephospho-CoA synthase CitG [Oscillospiraceae bacterium]|nr:triphosphoribosyl-dephospho-CoA synthase CitG [Oscillospiraceae bacterium]